MKFQVRDLAYIALGAALIAVCSWISIPTLVPFTLQTFAVCLISALLGWKLGLVSVAVYIALAAVGVPVLSGFKGGIAALMGPTGGYVVGFLFTAFIVGFAAEKWNRKAWILAAAMVVGILVCYAFGTAWFVPVYSRAKGPIGVGTALMMCVVPYLIPDAVKIALATFLVGRIYPLIHRRSET